MTDHPEPLSEDALAAIQDRCDHETSGDPAAILATIDCRELLAEVRLDERIKTLREAAKLVCYKCNNGTPVAHVKIDWYHLSVIGQPQACMAASLHDRVAELEAERAGASQEKNSPCAEQKNS